MTRLRVIDLETTGTEPPAEIIEFGRVDVVITDHGASVEPPQSWLYRPLRGIPPETMAVHHITEADFGPATPVCTPDQLHAAVWSGPAPAALVAHSCAFERQFVTEATTGAIPWICTYKVALHVWPDAPRHSNQVLRYWRGLTLDNALAMPPHRAGPDAWVTAHLLAELARFASFDQMVAWTREPRPMPVLTFGKHRGQPWAQVPSDYLQWMISQTDMDADMVWHARQELARRAEKTR
ncbi:exonuclease domain-containing protein [Phenylobacterium sp.]|uniref:exonuclease domain-containing protein n=1 Tax=Phenylobacterium sp. TaxID=1871053 RepID=UPI0035AE63F1